MPHHVTQRGIRKLEIFKEPADYQRYTDLIIDNCNKYGILVRSHSWMPNHVHMVAIPLRPDSFAKALRGANSIYARWFNKKYGLSGYLWQGRYYSCPLNEDHFWAAMRYVERNPVQAGLVARAEDYRWSSAAYHCFGRRNALIDPTWDTKDVIPDWSSWLAIPNDPFSDETIRASTRKGFPCGDERFVSDMEERLKRVLRDQKRGPKRQVLKEESGFQLE